LSIGANPEKEHTPDKGQGAKNFVDVNKDLQIQYPREFNTQLGFDGE
jgi:hypothetical protein